jgi:hypothetical protein
MMPNELASLQAGATERPLGLDGRTKSPVDEFEREHSFGDEPLKGVIPAWPTVQQTSLQDERVYENCKRRRPRGQPEPIDSIERFAIQRHQMLCLLTGILLLGGEPACKWFAIVVKDLQPHYPLKLLRGARAPIRFPLRGPELEA